MKKPSRNATPSRSRKPEAAARPAPGRAAAGAWLWPLAGLAAALFAMAARLQPSLLYAFYNDDFVYMDAVSRRPWTAAFLHPLRIGGYLRPLSRDLHFKLAYGWFGLDAHPWHVLNLVLLGAAVALLYLLARRHAGPRGAVLAASLFALSHVHAVLVGWVCCDQDLWALVFALLSAWLFARGNAAASAVAFAAALLSKESAALLPVMLFVVARGERRAAARALAPHFVLAAAWGVAYALARGPESSLHWSAGAAAALPLRALLAAAGVEAPRLWAAGLGRDLPWAAVLGAAAAGAAASACAAGAGGARRALPWLAWAALALAPVLPVASQWSGYYFGLAFAGLYLAAGIALERAPAACAALPVLLLLSGEATLREPVDPGEERPDATVSAVSVARLALGTATVSQAVQQIPQQVPTPAPRSAFVFSGLPNRNGFISGDGPALRLLYGDTSLVAGYLGDLGVRVDLSRPLVMVTFAPGSGFQARPTTPAQLATLKYGLEISGHPEGAAAALRSEEARGTLPRALVAWNRGYLLWESGDGQSAEKSWREAAALGHVDASASALADRRASLAPSKAAEMDSLRRAALGRPRDAELLVRLGEAAMRAGDALTYAAWYRAALLAPGDTSVVNGAVRALEWGGFPDARGKITRGTKAAAQPR